MASDGLYLDTAAAAKAFEAVGAAAPVSKLSGSPMCGDDVFTACIQPAVTAWIEQDTAAAAGVAAAERSVAVRGTGAVANDDGQDEINRASLATGLVI